MSQSATDRLTPLSPSAMQLVIGSALGDGSITPASRHVRLAFVHSTKQEGYCRMKAEMLAPYVQTSPKVTANQGWGRSVCTFRTVTTPVFDFLRSAALRPDPLTGRLVRAVTAELLALLDWPGVAIWYMDDGAFSRNGPTAFLHTERYTLAENEMLAGWFSERGMRPSVDTVKIRGRKAWNLRFRGRETRLLIDKISEYKHPDVAYKFDVPMMVFRPCSQCGSPTQQKRAGESRTVLCSPECRAAFAKAYHRARYLARTQPGSTPT